MRIFISFLWSMLLVCVLFNSVSAEVAIGRKVPNFHFDDSTGKRHSLDEFTGRFLVLEWFNYECPFVKKHYNSQNMQKLQSTYTAKGVTWISVNSSAEGKQGYLTAEAAEMERKSRGVRSSFVALDPKGELGRLFSAKTTPHMFVIGPDATLLYAGAIDDNSSTKEESVASAKNYVAAALDEALSAKPVTMPETKPYGCGVKYEG
jgi:peroxiredoxin